MTQSQLAEKRRLRLPGLQIIHKSLHRTDLGDYALQGVVILKAYSAAFKYTVFECQSTPSNPPFRASRLQMGQIHAALRKQTPRLSQEARRFAK